jgi:hypothetical protein
MSIGVQSYTELYTTMLGLGLYDKFWELLTQTGIAYLPFIGMIAKNITHSYVVHGTRDAGPLALRTMEVNLIVTILLILFGVAPCIPFDAKTISYAPQCGRNNGQTYYAGNTGTTYDKAFILPTENIKVPMWWYLVISVSEGLTNAANTMVGCVPDLRKMVTQVNMTKISNPEIKQELQDFSAMCYLPARLQLNQDQKNNVTSHLERIQEDEKKYGKNDIEWLGSHSFNNLYYPNLKASREIPGFSYEASQDINADILHSNPPAFGTPACDTWWNDQQHGLKNRVYQSLPKSFFEEFKDYLNDDKSHDDILKNVISDTWISHDSNPTVQDGVYSEIATTLGIWYHQLEEYPKLYAAREAAPIIQALLLLMIYVFLPFALIFSGYRPATFVTGAILIFSVIFWGFIWRLVSWTDSALMQALYSGWFVRQGAGATLADMIIASLVIVSPIFWFVFMGAMGVAAGDIVSGLSTGLNKTGANAANKGAKTIEKVGVGISTLL